MDGGLIQDVEVTVDVYLLQEGSLYDSGESAVDGEGNWAHHLGYLCDGIDFSAYSMRARYRVGTEEWKATPRQPIWAAEPTSCDRLIADDIVLPASS